MHYSAFRSGRVAKGNLDRRSCRPTLMLCAGDTCGEAALSSGAQAHKVIAASPLTLLQASVRWTMACFSSSSLITKTCVRKRTPWHEEQSGQACVKPSEWCHTSYFDSSGIIHTVPFLHPCGLTHPCWVGSRKENLEYGLDIFHFYLKSAPSLFEMIWAFEEHTGEEGRRGGTGKGSSPFVLGNIHYLERRFGLQNSSPIHFKYFINVQYGLRLWNSSQIYRRSWIDGQHKVRLWRSWPCPS